VRVCLICDLDLHQNPKRPSKPYVGPILKLRTGVLEHRKWGMKLVPHHFEDEEICKWVHGPCAKRAGIVVTQLKRDHCILCGLQIEMEGDGHFGDTVLRIERGHLALEVWEVEDEDDEDAIKVRCAGYVHFNCAVMDDGPGDWRLPLINLQVA